MSPIDPNPYQSPTHISAAETQPHVTRWRLIPAILFFLLGMLVFGFGLFAVYAMIYVIIVGEGAPLVWMIAGCTLYLGAGVSWMLAGWCFWRQKYRRGIIAVGIGFLIPITIFCIMGF